MRDNMLEEKKKKIIDRLNLDLGLVLSYGISNDIIPSGAFVATDVVSDYESILKIKFERVDGNLNDYIYIPIDNINKLYNDSNSLLSKTFDKDNIKYVNRILSDLVDFYNEKTIGLGYKDFAQYSLEEMGATYVRNGEFASDNYSVVPFNYGYTRKLVKTMYSDAEKSSQKETASHQNTM